jgi:hypothetical protein
VSIVDKFFEDSIVNVYSGNGGFTVTHNHIIWFPDAVDLVVVCCKFCQLGKQFSAKAPGSGGNKSDTGSIVLLKRK